MKNLPITSRNINAPIIDLDRQGILGYNDLASDAWGKQKVVSDYSLMHCMATFDISPKVWYVDENNIELANSSLSTRATPKKGGFNIDSGASINDSTVLRGKRHPRYQPNRGWIFSTAGVLPSKNALGKRIFGGYTEESGFFFELNNGVLYAVVRQANWQYWTATVSQTTFSITDCTILPTSTVIVRTRSATSNIWGTVTTGYLIANSVLTFTTGLAAGDRVMVLVVDDRKADITQTVVSMGVDIEKEVVYDIQSQWRGAGDVFFFVNLTLVYTYKNLGVNTQPSISNPALPISFTAINQGNQVSMLMGCADVSSEGGMVDKVEYLAIVNKPQTPIPVTGVTLPDKVLMVVYTPTYFKGRHNSRDFQVLRVTASTDANAFLNVYRSRNPIWTNGSLLLKARTDGSSLLYDNGLDSIDATVRGLTLDIASAELISTFRVPANDSRSLDNPHPTKVDYTLSHGDYLIITGLYEKNGVANMLSIIELGEEI